MTKYILHGGETSRKTEDNRRFFQEMVGNKDSIHVLCVYYSQPEESRAYFYEQDQQRFAWACPNKTINLTIADIENDLFTAQISKHDVIYLKGWLTIRLLQKLQTVEWFAELIQGKVVSGSSAGACVLSTYYFTGNHDSVITKWLWILPIKVFVHYDLSKESQAKELEKYGDQDLPMYRIPEEKMCSIEQ